MVYIYSKKIGNKVYYYLRLDKKINNKKIVKDIAYLGSDLSKIDLNHILENSEYKKEIKKSYHKINKVINSNYFLDKVKSKKFKKEKYLIKENQILLESIKLHFKSRFGRLEEITKDDFFNNFIINYTYNTTSIEGNTIPLNDVKNILTNDRFKVDNASLREIYDLRNTKDTFNYILKNKLRINVNTILKIHKMLLKDIDSRDSFRNFDVRVFKSHFDSTPYFRIHKEIDDLIKWFNSSDLHPFVKASIFHHRFEKIHPFADGNGRTGRMLFNIILLNSKFPPIIITKKNRNKYLDSLSFADKNENYSKLIEFLLKEYEEGYWKYFLV